MQRLRWPSSLANFGNAVAQPRGRLIAVSFANPPPARQLEVWLFDGVTSTFSPLTGLITQPADALPVDRSIRAGRAVTGERLTPRTAR